MKTLLVAGADLGSVQEAFSFWEAKLAVMKGAVKSKRVDFSTLIYSAQQARIRNSVPTPAV